MNQGIITSFATITITQLIKPPLHKIKTGYWNWSSVLDTGGMPSSHSAGVTSLSTYVGLKKGFNSVDFAFCTLFGLIVMYDAMGIRRHAGEIAIEVNNLDREIEELAGKKPGIFHEKKRKHLKESLGHQPREVLAGLLLGIVAGSISYWMNHRKHYSRSY